MVIILSSSFGLEEPIHHYYENLLGVIMKRKIIERIHTFLVIEFEVEADEIIARQT